jgi:type VI protein secretion system component VasK
MAEQNFANHPKFVPGYHYALFAILGVNLIWSIFRLIYGLPGVPIYDRVLSLAVAFALLLMALYVRTFPLRAQDRVIRLEETLRLERLLPADLKPRIADLRTHQLIALRFASDAELPELTREVLDGKVTGSKEIKQRVKSWRADHLRM